MTRFARVAASLALAAALCCRAQASAAPAPAHLDPARMFNAAAESLLSNLFIPPKDLSPISVALFGAPIPPEITIELPREAPAVATGSGTVHAVTLQAYTPPVKPLGEPLARPSIAPAAPITHAQLAQTRVTVPDDPPAVRFGSYMTYAPTVQGLKANVQVPVRIGAVHFSGTISGEQLKNVRGDAVRAMQLCGTTDEAAACPYLHDEKSQSVVAGTNFNVRAGNANVNVQLSGSVDRVTSGDTAVYQYSALAADPQLDSARAGSPEDSSLLYYPGLTDIVRHGVNARLAVPVSRALTVGLQYDRTHYQGNYATLLAPGLDARKDTYLGNVTYQLPNSSSLLTLSARQYRYQDSFAPNFSLTETRADLTFTVKF